MIEIVEKADEINFNPTNMSEDFVAHRFYLQEILQSALNRYSNPSFQNIKILKENFDLFGFKKFITAKTSHCEDSFGLIIEHNSGSKIVYSGDTIPSEDLIRKGKNASILIHEATYLEKNYGETKSDFHSTISEAIKVGFDMKAWRTVLTHFSLQSYNLDPNEVIKNNEELAVYAKENVILAVDHLKAKISEFEYLPYINKCINIIHPKQETRNI